MEFIIFLGKLDKEILDLLIKANYIVEENKVECLLNKEIKGLHKFKENKIIICTEMQKEKQILEIRINNQIKITSKQKSQ